MTSFSRTWNAAYEAQPADTENISIGASRIRDLKTDIQERLEVDHFHAGDTDDGAHKKVDFAAPLGADPANVANHGFLYTKDVSAKVELFWIDEDGNVVQLTTVGSINIFASGTSLLFYQSAAPAGWTKDVAAALDDHAIRVVTTTGWTTGSKGSNAFTAALSAAPTAGGHVLTIAEMPAHTHLTGDGATDSANGATSHSVLNPAGSLSSGSTGGDGSHIHDFDINYIDVIRATKD